MKYPKSTFSPFLAICLVAVGLIILMVLFPYPPVFAVASIFAIIGMVVVGFMLCIVVLGIPLAIIVGCLHQWGPKWLRDFLSCPPLTREKAAELIDEFADLEWGYGDNDLYFSQKYEDPVLAYVAEEFRKIQKDYEMNIEKNDGGISEENLRRLRELKAKLLSTPTPEDSQNIDAE